jgi:Predicted membrane protein
VGFRVQPVFTGGRLKTCLMPVFRLLPAVLFACLLAVPVSPASAGAAHHACLTKAEQRAEVASRRAIPLADAIRSVRGRKRVEVVRARLCRRSGRLVYLLTLLARSGKVTRAAIDAATGEHIKGR